MRGDSQRDGAARCRVEVGEAQAGANAEDSITFIAARNPSAKLVEGVTGLEALVRPRVQRQ